jgi:hypothetical protein
MVERRYYFPSKKQKGMNIGDFFLILRKCSKAIHLATGAWLYWEALVSEQVQLLTRMAQRGKTAAKTNCTLLLKVQRCQVAGSGRFLIPPKGNKTYHAVKFCPKAVLVQKPLSPHPLTMHSMTVSFVLLEGL